MIYYKFEKPEDLVSIELEFKNEVATAVEVEVGVVVEVHIEVKLYEELLIEVGS